MIHRYPKGTAIIWEIQWVFEIFLDAADCELPFYLIVLLLILILITVVMIWRVYAMWGRSKRILCLLLCIYVPQIIVGLVLVGIYNTGTYMSGMSQMIFTCHSNLTQVARSPPATLLPSHSCPTYGFLSL